MAKIERTTGIEGPRHDPYSWEKWSVTKNDKTFTLHAGLIEVFSINGKQVETDHPVTLFEDAIGCTVRHLERAYIRYRHTCKTCGCRYTYESSGYPGESFNVCMSCNDIVSSEFHLSEII